jgi:hypothetical protein
MKNANTKKTQVVDDEDPLDREIDFTNAVRGKYARDYGQSRNLRILAPELLELFPDSDSVNEVLRAVAAIAARIAKPAETVSARRVAAPKRQRKRP